MEELINRFEIARLATKISDHETIALQAKKLREISTNDELNDIVSMLESRNYRQALFAMKEYLDSAESSFLNMPKYTDSEKKKMSQKESEPQGRDEAEEGTKTEPENEPEKPTNLFDWDLNTESEKKVISLDEMLHLTEESASETIVVHDIVKDIEEYVEQTKDEISKDDSTLNIYEEAAGAPESKLEEEVVQELSSNVSDEIGDTKEIEIEENENLEKNIDSDVSEKPEVSELDIVSENIESSEKGREEHDQNEKLKSDHEEMQSEIPMPKKYSSISYIEQKYRNMLHQFPQVEEREEGIAEEINKYLKQFSTSGYDDNDINNILSMFKSSKESGDIAKAAQFILLAAATESNLAQLLLARELFNGTVLKKDLPEAFTQINRLAEHDYPEAICDLAQLYEYGHGIKKDKKTALLLYEEALEMGVERARKHVERLTNSKPLFGRLLKI